MYESMTKQKRFQREHHHRMRGYKCKLTKPRLTRLLHSAQWFRKNHTPRTYHGRRGFIFVLQRRRRSYAGCVGALAAEVMARAINRAVYMAEPAYGLKAAKDFL